MKELELLKKDWKKQEASLPHIQMDALYTMVHKRSSSLTKWILIISIIEFVFWIALNVYAYAKDSFEEMRDYHFYEANLIIIFLNLGILVYFIFKFYKNYKSLRTTESVRELMQRILKVRSTVNQYVILNISFQFISAVLMIIAMFRYDPMFTKLLDASKNGSSAVSFWGLVAILALFVAVLMVALWLFYRLLYGILLRRLLRNYKELNKLEFNN